MNSRFLRAIIVAALGLVHGLGGMNSGGACGAQVRAPACGMTCCVKNVCECQPVLTDAPSQPVPLNREGAELEAKFAPILLTILPAPVARRMLSAVLPASAEGAHLGKVRETPVFRLHCALLM